MAGQGRGVAMGAGHGRGRKQGDKKGDLVQGTARFLPPPPPLPTAAHHGSLGFPSVPSSPPLPSCQGPATEQHPSWLWVAGREGDSQDPDAHLNVLLIAGLQWLVTFLFQVTAVVLRGR